MTPEGKIDLPEYLQEWKKEYDERWREFKRDYDEHWRIFKDSFPTEEEISAAFNSGVLHYPEIDLEEWR